MKILLCLVLMFLVERSSAQVNIDSLSTSCSASSEETGKGCAKVLDNVIDIGVGPNEWCNDGGNATGAWWEMSFPSRELVRIDVYFGCLKDQQCKKFKIVFADGTFDHLRIRTCWMNPDPLTCWNSIETSYFSPFVVTTSLRIECVETCPDAPTDFCIRDLGLFATDPCSIHVCWNSGTCSIEGAKAVCSCARGFQGKNCETAADPNEGPFARLPSGSSLVSGFCNAVGSCGFGFGEAIIRVEETVAGVPIEYLKMIDVICCCEKCSGSGNLPPYLCNEVFPNLGQTEMSFENFMIENPAWCNIAV